jgi:hypothetical protein
MCDWPIMQIRNESVEPFSTGRGKKAERRARSHTDYRYAGRAGCAATWLYPSSSACCDQPRPPKALVPSTSFFSLLHPRHQNPRDPHCDYKPHENGLHDFHSDSTCDDARHSREERATCLCKNENEAKCSGLQLFREKLGPNGHTLNSCINMCIMIAKRIATYRSEHRPVKEAQKD